MVIPVWHLAHFIIPLIIYLAANEASLHYSFGLEEMNVYLYKLTQFTRSIVATHQGGSPCDSFIHSSLFSHKDFSCICVHIFLTVFYIFAPSVTDLSFVFLLLLSLISLMVIYLTSSFSKFSKESYCQPCVMHVHTTISFISPTFLVAFRLSHLGYYGLLLAS
jgi:hypothetical protein